MKRSLFSPPDEFSVSPLLSVLPIKGKVGRLEALTTSIFARYEKVAAALKDTTDAESKKRNAAEEAMLRQVLEFLEINPEQS